jgi:hypothetical protein
MPRARLEVRCVTQRAILQAENEQNGSRPQSGRARG